MNWALVALTGECATEVGQAAMGLVLDFGAAEAIEKNNREIVETPVVVLDDATPVLKLCYEPNPT